ncbi:hypothetical protein AKJ16_DCAP11059 [Drosera capensis]
MKLVPIDSSSLISLLSDLYLELDNVYFTNVRLSPNSKKILIGGKMGTRSSNPVQTQCFIL